MIKNLAYRHRWIKRLLSSSLPDIDSLFLTKQKMQLYFSAKDLTGPSFHLSYSGEVGFQNYEEEDKNYVVEYLKKRPGLFIDIGANIGLFSFYIISKLPEQKIMAFEPETQAFRCLELSKKANHFTHFTPLKFAIAETEEELLFYIDKKNFGGHRLNRTTGNEESIKITTAPLKNFVQGQSISAIKIDVEGAELGVLKGIREIIKQDKPLVVIECLNDDLANKGELFQELNQYSNLKCFCFDLNKSVTLEEISLYAKEQIARNHHHNNYFLEFY